MVFFPLSTCNVSFFSAGQSASALFIAFSELTRVKITIIVMSRLDSEMKQSERTGLRSEARVYILKACGNSWEGVQ